MSKRLDEIQERWGEATPGPWVADVGVRGDCVVWGPNGRFLMNAQAEPHWREYPGETRSVAFDVDRRDVTAIAHARMDVPALVSALRGVLYLHQPKRWTEYNVPCFDEFDSPTVVHNGCSCESRYYPCETVRAINDALEGIDDA